MLPVVAGDEHTSQQIWLYTLLLVPATLLLVYPMHVSGAVYGLGYSRRTLNSESLSLLQNPSDRGLARSLSSTRSYMMLLCAGMVIDSLPITHQLLSAFLLVPPSRIKIEFVEICILGESFMAPAVLIKIYRNITATLKLSKTFPFKSRAREIFGLLGPTELVNYPTDLVYLVHTGCWTCGSIWHLCCG